MKKIISLILAIITVLSFVACGKTKVEEPTQLPTELPTEEVTELVTETIVEETDEEVDDTRVENTAKPEEDKAPVEDNAAEATLGNTLLAFFNEKANEGKSVTEIAEAISTHPSILFSCMALEVEPGFLPGFDAEITDFTKAVSFAPMIGSIAFVGYVFETDDADGLISTLKDNANLRWNICVEAEEMIVGKNGNKVFFVMCPKSLENAE